jgi:hypothetical protein
MLIGLIALFAGPAIRSARWSYLILIGLVYKVHAICNAAALFQGVFRIFTFLVMEFGDYHAMIWLHGSFLFQSHFSLFRRGLFGIGLVVVIGMGVTITLVTKGSADVAVIQDGHQTYLFLLVLCLSLRLAGQTLDLIEHLHLFSLFGFKIVCVVD